MEDQKSDQYFEDQFNLFIRAFLLIKQDHKQDDNNSGKER